MADIVREPAPGAPEQEPDGQPGAQAGVPAPVIPADHLSFLLVQLGLHGARRFGERLAPLGLEQRHAGMLFRLAAHEGQSQQALAELIGVNATRMVFLVDELEKLGLVERRRNPADRRSHALYLTGPGRAAVDQVRAVTAEHEAELGAGLTGAQRAQLVSLLRVMAREQGLHPRGLPGSSAGTAAGRLGGAVTGPAPAGPPR